MCVALLVPEMNARSGAKSHWKSLKNEPRRLQKSSKINPRGVSGASWEHSVPWTQRGTRIRSYFAATWSISNSILAPTGFWMAPQTGSVLRKSTENEKSDVLSTASAVPAAAVSTKGTDSGGSSRASAVIYYPRGPKTLCENCRPRNNSKMRWTIFTKYKKNKCVKWKIKLNNEKRKKMKTRDKN